MKKISRRDFVKSMALGGAALGIGAGVPEVLFGRSKPIEEAPIVSVVKIKNDNVEYAIREAIDLLGGINTITAGKERIMLKLRIPVKAATHSGPKRPPVPIHSGHPIRSIWPTCGAKRRWLNYHTYRYYI